MPVKLSRKKSKTYSVSIRFEKAQINLEDLRNAARKDGRSINQFSVRAIAAAIEKVNAPDSATPTK